MKTNENNYDVKKMGQALYYEYNLKILYQYLATGLAAGAVGEKSVRSVIEFALLFFNCTHIIYMLFKHFGL